jgi:hypothetical protein
MRELPDVLAVFPRNGAVCHEDAHDKLSGLHPTRNLVLGPGTAITRALLLQANPEQA